MKENTIVICKDNKLYMNSSEADLQKVLETDNYHIIETNNESDELSYYYIDKDGKETTVKDNEELVKLMANINEKDTIVIKNIPKLLSSVLYFKVFELRKKTKSKSESKSIVHKENKR